MKKMIYLAALVLISLVSVVAAECPAWDCGKYFKIPGDFELDKGQTAYSMSYPYMSIQLKTTRSYTICALDSNCNPERFIKLFVTVPACPDGACDGIVQYYKFVKPGNTVRLENTWLTVKDMSYAGENAAFHIEYIEDGTDPKESWTNPNSFSKNSFSR